MAQPLRDLVLPALDVDRAGEPWPLIRAGIVGSLLLVVAIGAWVWLAPLSGAVIGAGQVKVDMNRKTVQHQEGGIVGEILVRDGSKVKAGQTLILLKDVRVDAGNEAVRTQLDAELAKAARLAAEQAGAAQDHLPRRADATRLGPARRRAAEARELGVPRAAGIAHEPDRPASQPGAGGAGRDQGARGAVEGRRSGDQASAR